MRLTSLYHSVATLSILGCWKRFRRGTLWWFRLSDGYISPNTSVLSQTCFALYSICECRFASLSDSQEGSRAGLGLALKQADRL